MTVLTTICDHAVLVPLLDLPHRHCGRSNSGATDWGKIVGRIGDEKEEGEPQRSRRAEQPRAALMGVGIWAGIIE